jgi:hypothetical protein
MHKNKALSRKFESYMPFIWKRINNGDILIPGKCHTHDKETGKWITSPIKYPKPDYLEFRRRRFQTEEDCISVLFGVPHVNGLASTCSKVVFDLDIPEWRVYDDSYDIERCWEKKLTIKHHQHFKNKTASVGADFSLPFELNKELDRLSEGIVVHAYHLLLTMLNMHQVVRLGVKKGFIESDKDINYYRPENIKNGSLFFHELHYDSLSFLGWMSESGGYTIPDELHFYRDDKGQLKWADPITDGAVEKNFPEHPSGKDREKDPVYIAVKVRQALMDGLVYAAVPETGRFKTDKQRLTKYVADLYNDILSGEKQKAIISLVNDGAGHGGKR